MNTKTLWYILKRIALALLTVWVVITVTFFVMRAVPGGPFLGEKAISEAAQAALEAKYGLDKPVFEQYTTYLGDILTKFDFGPSLKQRGQDVIRQTPFGRMGDPEELCGTIHYLMSDASKFVTGTVAVVDGGFNAFSM